MQLLITVGDDGPEKGNFHIKIWKLDKASREGGPMCQKVTLCHSAPHTRQLRQ